jgi:NAD(P)H-dependent FMN reductase
LQASSGNLALVHAAVRSAPAGVEVHVFDGIRELPHFDPDLEASGVPGAVLAWRSALSECDAVLIASPEYGHSLPGALKNAIDWVIGSGELHVKPVLITAAVGAPERGRRGLSALRQTLNAVNARVVGDEPTVKGPAFERDVAALVRALADTVS